MPQAFSSDLVEVDLSDIQQSPLINNDIAPTKIAQRTWGTYNIAALWIGMSVCIPTYMLASGLIAGGMSWWQALLTVTLGNIIVLVPMVLNAHAGTKYGIPFPVLARASFGTIGSNVPALLRAVVACGWFGIQTWIGGQAFNSMIILLLPQWAIFEWGPAVGFLIFWAMNVYFIVKGTESIKWLESYAAPFLIVVGLGLLAWAYIRGGGFGPILSQPSKFETVGEFWKFFVPSLTGMVGFWATLSLNIPDFSRYAKSQRSQMLGQAIGLPPTMALFAFIGVAVTSATVVIFGEAIWDPVALLSRFQNPFVVILSLVSLLVATLTTNIAANVVSPANDFANLFPKKITFVRGGLITAVLGIVMMPWKLLSDYGTYIFGWLIGYSSFLGPIAGVLIADYFLVRRQHLNVKDLYVRGGEYEYSGGFNPKALLALAAGVIVALIGLVVPELRFLYDYAWFVGFAVAFVVYMFITQKEGSMKNFVSGLFLGVLFLSPTESHAQWQPDVRLTNNSALSNTSYNNAWCIAASGDVIHVVWYDGRDGNDEVYYKRSTNGGVSWGGDTRLTNNSAFSGFPSVTVSGQVVHVVWHDERDGNAEIYYKRSTNGGISWEADSRLTNDPSASRYSSVTVSTSVVHVVWMDFRHLPYEIYYKRSTDGGVSWGADTRLTNDPSDSRYPSVAVSGQVVHVVWQDTRDGSAGEIYYKRSTDGGISWEIDTRLTNDPAFSEYPSVSVSGQAVHVVWWDNRDANLEIYYKRSTDGGVSWGADTRLTIAPSSSVYPSVSVSGQVVHVVWQDGRDTPPNEIYYKRSTDGGVSWGADTRLTIAPTISTYPSVTVSGQVVHVVWTDNRDGNEEIYYKRDSTGNPVGIININSEPPKGFSLSQNYPNPFNPSTEIRFQVQEQTHVRLSIYNVLGEEMLVLLNEAVPAGQHTVKLDASSLSSGVYWYRLTTTGFATTRKMILLR